MHQPASAPTLTDEGVTLRAHHDGDQSDIIDQCRDPLTQRWTRVPVPYTTSHASQFVAQCRRKWQDGSSYPFAIEENGRFAGSLSLVPQGEGALTMSYGLAPWARGRHVVSRALRIGLAWGFEAHEPEVVLWSAIAGNWASRRAAWSVGVRVEGTVRGLTEQRGIRLDGWIGSIRRGDPLEPAHPWFDPPVITGDGVLLRPHATQDISVMAQACNDPVTQHWLPQLPRPYTPEDARAHLEEIAEEHAAGRSVFWAIADPVTRQLAGEIGIWGMAQGESRTGEIGYWTHPSARGRGLTTGAVRLAARRGLLPGGQGGIGLARLVIRVAVGNVPSQRVAEQAGFKITGCDRQAQLLRDGTPVDLLRYDLLRAELPGTQPPGTQPPRTQPPRTRLRGEQRPSRGEPA